MKKDKNLTILALLGLAMVSANNNAQAQTNVPKISETGVIAQILKTAQSNPDRYQLYSGDKYNFDSGISSYEKDAYSRSDSCPHDRSYNRDYEKQNHDKDYTQYDKCVYGKTDQLQTSEMIRRNKAIDSIVSIRIAKFKNRIIGS